jgi:hypothetical protein
MSRMSPAVGMVGKCSVALVLSSPWQVSDVRVADSCLVFSFRDRRSRDRMCGRMVLLVSAAEVNLNASSVDL